MCVCLCTNTHVRTHTTRQHSAIVIPFTYISLTALKHIFFFFLFRLSLTSRASLILFRSLSSASSGLAIAVSAYYTTFSFTLRNWYWLLWYLLSALLVFLFFSISPFFRFPLNRCHSLLSFSPHLRDFYLNSFRLRSHLTIFRTLKVFCVRKFLL